MTRKGQPKYFTWTERKKLAFDALKECITSAPILRLPDFGKQFVVRTDASNTDLGAVLLQKHGDVVFQ